MDGRDDGFGEDVEQGVEVVGDFELGHMKPVIGEQ
jgi:hypothetical protein